MIKDYLDKITIMRKEYVINEEIFNSLYVTSLEYTYNSIYSDKISNLFNINSLPDYIMHLTRDEMPVFTIARNRNKLVQNVRMDKDFIFDENRNHNTELPKLTTYELLGEFTVFDKYIIDELKAKGKTKHEYYSNGKKEIMEIDDMLGKRVILICDELIEELCDNVKLLRNSDDINNYFKLYKYAQCVEIDNFQDEVKSYFQYDTIKKMVFLHEFGHCMFYETNIKKGIQDMKLHEKQANFFSSIALNGEYDLLLEIFNNILIEDYHNPLLKTADYKLGQTKFKEEINRLFGE